MKYFLFICGLLIFLPSIYGGEIINKDIIEFTTIKATEYGIPVEIVFAIGIAESNWKNTRSIYNSNGTVDIGIMQLNSQYVSYYEEAFWYKETPFNVWNPKHNIEMAIIYLAHLYSYTHNFQHAIQAYNRGLHAVKQNENVGLDYLARVSQALTNIKVFTDEYIYYEDMR